MPAQADLFEKLDNEWRVFVRSRSAAEALARWQLLEPGLRGVADLDSLLEALRGRVQPERRDERMLAALRLASQDAVARRVVLQVVRPALSNLARWYGRWLGYGDTASAVIVVALERIASFPTDRRIRNLAAQIVRDTRHVFYEQLLHDRVLDAELGWRTNIADVEDELEAPPERTAADRVLVLIRDAVKSGRITRRHGQLVVDSRLLGISARDIAATSGTGPQSVRRMRQRVEAALVDGAVA